MKEEIDAKEKTDIEEKTEMKEKIKLEEKITQLQEIIDNSNKIVFFGGAGVSTESGIPDFRSSDGLYSLELGRNFTPEELVSHTMYLKYTKEFFQFYRTHLIYPEAKPNNAHKYLAKLEKQGKLSAIVTQNIDTLHEMAGSQKVLKIHGTIDVNTCTGCGRKYNLNEFLQLCSDIPRCPKCNSIIKPDVTLYEEVPNQNTFNEAIKQISQADTLIIGGTSLVVYPAASLIQFFQGKNLVLINKSKTSQDSIADLVIHKSIGEIFENLK